MDKLKAWLPFLIPLVVIAVSYGTLRAITDSNSARLDGLEKSMNERFIDPKASGLGILLLDRLQRIEEKLDHIDKQLDRIEENRAH